MNVNIFSYFLYTQDGLTPLSWACVHGLSDVAQLLINKGSGFYVTDGVSYSYPLPTHSVCKDTLVGACVSVCVLACNRLIANFN